MFQWCGLERGGFYERNGDSFSRLYAVPTRTERSILGKPKRCYSVPLEVSLRLGSDGFVGVE